jgi:hypothetical protein
MDEVKEGDVVYITIGVPFSNIPIMQKVMTYVEPTCDTPVTAAKKLRKMVADNIENYGWTAGTKFTPAELYYEIYTRIKDDIPFAMSFNSRYRKENIDGKQNLEITLGDTAWVIKFENQELGRSVLMDELLKALQEANALPEPPMPDGERDLTPEETRISGLACTLFIRNNGRINYAQVNEFEKYAPCKIYPVEQDSFGWLIGCIQYNDRKYYFG